MLLHLSLLAEARSSLEGFAGRPSQAKLRRAVSTGYYACFHRLTYESARIIVSGERGDARNYVRRGYKHGAMKEVCVTISSGRVPKRWPVGTPSASPELREACRKFVKLQDDRHRADYDVGAVLKLGDVKLILDEAEQFQTLMDSLSQGKSESFRLFAIALLAQVSIY